MKTYKECCSEVAQKYGLGNSLVTGHKASYYREAAVMYAQEIVDEIECGIYNYVSISGSDCESEVQKEEFQELKDKINEDN